MLAGAQGWEVRPAGKGSKGNRWYAWAWLGTASPRHYLLVRRHLATGELAFCYCYVPGGQPVTKGPADPRLCLRWPKDCFGLDQSQVRLYAVIARRAALVMAALAICAVTAACYRPRYLNIQRLNYLWTIRHSSARIAGNLIT